MATGMRMLVLSLSLCVSQIAVADSLPDPTRPSIDLNAGSGVADVVPADEVTRGLQSIIISPKYRAAVINGETVAIGDKTGDSRLIEVRENSVVLQNAQGRRVVELFPKVGIRKNDKVRQDNAVQEKASGRTNLPEQDAGGNK